jgi:hypothetical protein
MANMFGIEDDILRIKANLFRQYFISTMTDLHFTLLGICLSLFIKSHYDTEAAIALADKCLLQ